MNPPFASSPWDSRGRCLPEEDSLPQELWAAWRRERAARLRAEAALARERTARSEDQTRVASALVAARVGTWRMDVRTGFITRDAFLQRLLGVESQGAALPTLGWSRRVHPEDVARVDAEFARALRERASFSLDYRIVRPDGGVRWVRDRGAVLMDEDGLPLHLTGVTTDITEEQQVSREHTGLEQRLIGIVSHDLRSPLSAILMGAQALMSHAELEPRVRRCVAHVYSSAERCVRMVRDLLDFTQARLGGGFHLQLQPLELHPLAEQTLEEVRLSHPERDILLRHEGDAHGEGDADRLAQVITNLVCNAVKYSPRDTPIEVYTRGTQEHLVLSVRNQGEPLPEALRGRLFEPMQRGGRDTSDRSVGLGLYIVKHLVEAHGGHVEVESSVSGGTCFTVWLPRHPTACPTPPLTR